MKEDVKTAVNRILSNYLEQNYKRKTPERFAILDAVCSMYTDFTLQDINRFLESKHFHVSRATLYNTVNLLQELRLVTSQRTKEGTHYEVAYGTRNLCEQICTNCGKISKVESFELGLAIDALHLRRFRKENFSLFIYGTCSTCQSRMTRKQNKIKGKV